MELTPVPRKPPAFIIEYDEEFLETIQEAVAYFKTDNCHPSLQTPPFDTVEDARLFARRANAWATENGLAFTRKPPRHADGTYCETIGDLPDVVAFRIAVPDPGKGRKSRKADK